MTRKGPTTNRSSPERRQGWWDTASGLQAVDQLVVPDDAHQVVGRYIKGDITSEEAVHQVEKRYADKLGTPDGEAAVVATRILEALDKGSLDFSPRGLAVLHGHLFKGVFTKVVPGKFRDYDIYKAEPVLDGRSVHYAPPHEYVEESLLYDLRQELSCRRKAPTDPTEAGDFAQFVAGIWQIYPFGEGNTRTCAVFAALYLRKLGADINNEPFKENNLYFRDALVRASYEDFGAGIYRDGQYLGFFFEKLLLDNRIDLTHVDMNLHGVRPSPEDDEYNPEGDGIDYRDGYSER